MIDRLLIIGPPGIGKTEIILQKSRERAREMYRIFVDLRNVDDSTLDMIFSKPERFYVFHRIIATHVFPEDVNIPVKKEKFVEFVPPRILKVLSLKGIAGTLFIDELTNVQRADQQTLFFSLIQEKELGWETRITDDVYVVAAGNRPEDSSVAGLLPSALVNRMTIIEVTPPTPEEWVQYMHERYSGKWDARVAAYILATRELYRPPTSTETLQNFPTPRSWTRLSLLLHELKPNNEMLLALAVGTVGPWAGAKFAEFVTLEVPKPEQIVANPALLKDLRSDIRKLMLATTLVASYIAERGDVETAYSLLRFMLEELAEPAIVMIGALPKDVSRRVLLKIALDISKGRLNVSEQFVRIWKLKTQ